MQHAVAGRHAYISTAFILPGLTAWSNIFFWCTPALLIAHREAGHLAVCCNSTSDLLSLPTECSPERRAAQPFSQSTDGSELGALEKARVGGKAGESRYATPWVEWSMRRKLLNPWQGKEASFGSFFCVGS